LDARDRLVMADHGNRRIARVDESNFTKTTLTERYDGKRLNSPNDLVYRSNGDLYFTDPPYGLDGTDKSPAKELPFNGVYRLTPADERTLYIAVSDPAHAVWMAYDVAADGTLARGRVFFDATPLVRKGLKGLPDGMKVDRQGNLFPTGPGGVLVFTP